MQCANLVLWFVSPIWFVSSRFFSLGILNVYVIYDDTSI